jgi:DNA-directed RNA polymerase subunit K/omega
MLYPTIKELTNDEFNRYELALATAKCARDITNEYVRQREAAEKAATGNKDADRNLINMINKEYRDEKAVKNAITKIHKGEYMIVRIDPTAEVEEEAEAAAEVEAEVEAPVEAEVEVEAPVEA